MWWNSVYRKIFGYNKWESMKEVICRLGRLNVRHMVNLRRLLFYKRIESCGNVVMLNLHRQLLCSPELVVARTKFNVCIHWSVYKISNSIYASFRNKCGMHT